MIHFVLTNQPYSIAHFMGIENLVVRFDDPSGVFYAGQTISGVVQFHTTQPYQSDGVFIKFIGRADVHWTE